MKQKNTYRPEIDGLRAIAVLGVILFHAGYDFVRGGYLGVDVFFVISGYLITRILLNDLQNNTFSFKKFYLRRIRRIAPALLFTLFFITLIFSIILNPIELVNYFKSLFATVIFIPNIYFWKNTGYFDTSSELNPLIHMWSLGVEEQFYIIFPIILFYSYKLIGNNTRNFLLAITILSLLFSLFLFNSDPSGSFYLPYLRAWELLIGSICAFIIQDINKKNLFKTKYSSILGFVLIFFTFVILAETDLSNVHLSVIAVIGTSLIILNDQLSILSRFLSQKIIVLIGKISFSAYLIHQPFFVLNRYMQKSYNLYLPEIFIIFFTLIFAYLSWKFIENPFRYSKKISNKSIITTYFPSTIIIIVVSYIGISNDGFAKIKMNTLQRDISSTAIGSPLRDKCHTSGSNYLSPSNACNYGQGNKRITVFGDSHVVPIAYALSKFENYNIKHLSFSGCPPAFDRSNKNKIKNGCLDWSHESINHINNDTSTDVVVIAYRLHSALFGVNRYTNYPNIPDEIGGTERDRRWQSLIKIINTFLDNNKNVILLLPPPELPFEINQLISVSSGDDIYGVTRDWWDRRSDFVNSKIYEISDKVKIIDPINDFCDLENCYAVKKSMALYWDDNHLSQEGASIIAKKIINSLESTLDK